MSRLKTTLAYLALPAVVLVAAALGLWLEGGLEPAPSFAMPIVAGEGARDGDRVSLEEQRGRVVLLDFWASWCAPCQESIPILNRIEAEYGAEVTLLGVNVEAGLTPTQIQAAHRDFGADFPSLHDEDGSLAAAYGVAGLPTLIVIDWEGRVVEARAGVPDEGRLGALISRLSSP